ncbi:choice-of-anchor tandem repeat GloVer-containing protein [Methylibium rhizosphaerae]|uniref:choice-of-anchor tandem repeat GloVer-containing protein n=1 Tax=Methylibium rhizosphaerae TaxID=2570323 RepID=UPI00112B4930|nr:choice-of-anchor tandem repeat GloVer-containing protein [Methylibium rhizosphaerae]
MQVSSLLRCAAVAALLAALSAAFQVAHAATYEILHHFGGPCMTLEECARRPRDGRNPYDTPVIDASGAIYGTTRTGGAHDRGTLWKWQSNVYTVLHDFTGSANDGDRPIGALVADTHGNLYGTTENGGRGFGVVYKWDTEHGLSLLHRFSGTDGAFPHDGVVRDALGNLYGTTIQGGPAYVLRPEARPCSVHGCGTIFRIDASGAFTMLHAFTPADGGYAPRRLARRGNVLYGGTANGSPLFKFALDPTMPGGGTFSIVHRSLTDGRDGYVFAGGMARGSSGSLYGVNAFGVRSYGGIYRIKPSDDYEPLHGFRNTDGAQPEGVVVVDETSNKVYGTTVGRPRAESDLGNMRFGSIWEFDLGTHRLNTLHVLGDINRNGIADDNCTGDPHPDECNEGMNPYTGLTRDAAGNLYGVALSGGKYGYGVLFRVRP